MGIRNRKTGWEILAALSQRWHRAKTATWYRLFFKSIGRKTVIRNPILLANPRFISVGSRVFIRDGARLEVVRRGQETPMLIIGNDVTIEQDFHVACCCNIVIGDYVSIAARCAVVDVTHPFRDVAIDSNIAGSVVEGAQKVVIGRRVFLGIGVTVLPNVEIGEGAVIGAHSVVTTDIPPYSIATGIPAKVTKYWRHIDVRS